MSTTYHACVALDAICRGDPIYVGIVQHYGGEWAQQASDSEIIAEATIRRARGMDAWPLCDHFDRFGHCKGHAVARRL